MVAGWLGRSYKRSGLTGLVCLINRLALFLTFTCSVSPHCHNKQGTRRREAASSTWQRIEPCGQAQPHPTHRRRDCGPDSTVMRPWTPAFGCTRVPHSIAGMMKTPHGDATPAAAAQALTAGFRTTICRLQCPGLLDQPCPGECLAGSGRGLLARIFEGARISRAMLDFRAQATTLRSQCMHLSARLG